MDKADNGYIQNLEKQIQELKIQNGKLRATIEEYRNKEQSISSAIIASMEHANQLEASRKKLYNLDIQRSRLMYMKMEQVIKDLYIKYPELEKDSGLKDMSNRFKTMIYNDLNERDNFKSNDPIKQPIVDDPIKKLLHNIINYIDTKKPEDAVGRGEPSKDLMKNKSESGFDFEEALHPTMELDEILKAFNLDKKNGTDSNKK